MTRRDSLNALSNISSTHAGLWLQKYIVTAGKDNAKQKKKLIDEVTRLTRPDGYDAFFQHWEESLGAVGATLTRACTDTQQRLVVGLGADSMLENSISLHWTFGVPLIPGSALKGLCSSFAHRELEDERWRKGKEWHNELFGNTKQSGAVIFFDALPFPTKFQLLEDVITVHHPEYYTGQDAVPADWDSPTPIPFISSSGTWLIALQGPGPWLEIAFVILKKALATYGIGAKTSSGYGRLKLTDPKSYAGELQRKQSKDKQDQKNGDRKTVLENPDNACARDLLNSVQIPPLQLKFSSNPGEYVPKFLELKPDPDVQLEVARGFRELIQGDLERKQRRKAEEKQREGKSHWFMSLLALLGEP